MTKIPSFEITDKRFYLDRRAFITTALAAAGASALVNPELHAQQPAPHGRRLATMKSPLRGSDSPNTWEHLTTYNNFYEFGTGKSDPALNARGFKPKEPWTISIEGECAKPGTLNLEDVLKGQALEDRIYRHRCVEGWSMVIPWVGYSLARLIEKVEPAGNAKFVEFISQADPKTMPFVGSRVLEWPYVEGLRLDEAMHPLTLLAFGMYGEVLPNQNGAPLRLVVPWKYGFKSGKSLVRIRFTDREPKTAWNKAAANEYGFYSNVNPDVDHPRWSQATERRIGEDGLFAKRRKTLMFNGYQAQVGQLYAGMDLKKNF